MNKKQIIEQTATELFWKYGFKKVSIDELCQKSKVSRKTFYTYYSNKNALVIEILRKVTEKIFTESEELIGKDLSFSEKMKELLEIKYAVNKNFSIEFVTDFFHHDSREILEFYNELSTKSIAFTRNFYLQSQQKGEINPELNIDFVIWMMQKQLELCSTDEALAMFKDGESMTKQLSQLLVYGIMVPGNNK